MNSNKQKRAEKQFNKFTINAKKEDIEKINAKLPSMNKGKLEEVWDSVMLLWKMTKDPNAPWVSKAIAIGALLYAISPIDAVPDIIPVFGLADDAGVVLSAVASLAIALKKYKN